MSPAQDEKADGGRPSIPVGLTDADRAWLTDRIGVHTTPFAQ